MAEHRESHFPSVLHVIEIFMRLGKTVKEAAPFFNYHEGLGWKKGITPITAIPAFANRWVAESKPTQATPTPRTLTEKDEW